MITLCYTIIDNYEVHNSNNSASLVTYNTLVTHNNTLIINHNTLDTMIRL
jgi:hypothetical protein